MGLGLECLTWRAFRAGSKLFGRHRPHALSLSGPVILVLLIFVWIGLFMVGSALIVHPLLGESITTTSGRTPTDFWTALHVAGDTLTTVGTAALAPRSSFARLFYTFNSLVGLSMITLMVTYLLEIYNALQRRNTLALKLHFAGGETADAAELLAGVGPEGEFSHGYTHLAETAAKMTAFKESQHFYSVLIYFRFRKPHYALARLALVTLDTVTLIKSALDDRRYAWLKESAAVVQLWHASMHLTTLLAMNYLPGGLPDAPDEPDAATLDRWRRRYLSATRRLRQAGIDTAPDEANGAVVYTSLRARWDRYVVAFADHMAHGMSDIDPVGNDPALADERQEFRTRLRAVG